VKLELEGFAAVTEGFEVPAEAGAPHDFTLKALKKDPGAVVVHRPPPPPPALSEPKGLGIVRFVVVDSWATVECPPYKFGDTPFEPQKLPAGEYKCTFVNSELQKKQTRVVKVEANETTKVLVSFEK